MKMTDKRREKNKKKKKIVQNKNLMKNTLFLTAAITTKIAYIKDIIEASSVLNVTTDSNNTILSGTISEIGNDDLFGDIRYIFLFFFFF